MMVLFAPDLMKGLERAPPAIYQQVDWSSGGDGIVVRGAIASVADLKGKTVVYGAELALPVLIHNLSSTRASSLQVKHKFTATAFEAAAAFRGRQVDRRLRVLGPRHLQQSREKVKGTRIPHHHRPRRTSIADVVGGAGRLRKDHPDVIKGLVAGILRRR